MMNHDDDHAQKSEPFWQRPLTLDFKGLFQTLGKATLHTSLKDWELPGKHASTDGISREDFRELLQEMALTAWHDRERVTTVKAVRDRCEHNHLNQVLEKYESRFSQGVSQ